MFSVVIARLKDHEVVAVIVVADRSVMTRDDVVAALGQAPRWASSEMDDVRVIPIGETRLRLSTSAPAIARATIRPSPGSCRASTRDATARGSSSFVSRLPSRSSPDGGTLEEHGREQRWHRPLTTPIIPRRRVIERRQSPRYRTSEAAARCVVSDGGRRERAADEEQQAAPRRYGDRA